MVSIRLFLSAFKRITNSDSKLVNKLCYSKPNTYNMLDYIKIEQVVDVKYKKRTRL